MFIFLQKKVKSNKIKYFILFLLNRYVILYIMKIGFFVVRNYSKMLQYFFWWLLKTMISPNPVLAELQTYKLINKINLNSGVGWV